MNVLNRGMFKNRDSRNRLAQMGGILSSSPELQETAMTFANGGGADLPDYIINVPGLTAEGEYLRISSATLEKLNNAVPEVMANARMVSPVEMVISEGFSSLVANARPGDAVVGTRVNRLREQRATSDPSRVPMPPEIAQVSSPEDAFADGYEANIARDNRVARSIAAASNEDLTSPAQLRADPLQSMPTISEEEKRLRDLNIRLSEEDRAMAADFPQPSKPFPRVATTPSDLETARSRDLNRRLSEEDRAMAADFPQPSEPFPRVATTPRDLETARSRDLNRRLSEEDMAMAADFPQPSEPFPPYTELGTALESGIAKAVSTSGGRDRDLENEELARIRQSPLFKAQQPMTDAERYGSEELQSVTGGEEIRNRLKFMLEQDKLAQQLEAETESAEMTEDAAVLSSAGDAIRKALTLEGVADPRAGQREAYRPSLEELMQTSTDNMVADSIAKQPKPDADAEPITAENYTLGNVIVDALSGLVPDFVKESIPTEVNVPSFSMVPTTIGAVDKKVAPVETPEVAVAPVETPEVAVAAEPEVAVAAEPTETTDATMDLLEQLDEDTRSRLGTEEESGVTAPPKVAPAIKEKITTSGADAGMGKDFGGDGSIGDLTKDYVKLLKSLLGESDEDKAARKGELFMLMGAALMSGKSSNALTNIGGALQIGAKAAIQDRATRKKREDTIGLKGFELAADRIAKREATEATIAAEGRAFKRDKLLLVERLKNAKDLAEFNSALGNTYIKSGPYKSLLSEYKQARKTFDDSASNISNEDRELGFANYFTKLMLESDYDPLDIQTFNLYQGRSSLPTTGGGGGKRTLDDVKKTGD